VSFQFQFTAAGLDVKASNCSSMKITLRFTVAAILDSMQAPVGRLLMLPCLIAFCKVGRGDLGYSKLYYIC
jgi:hypothetical protein